MGSSNVPKEPDGWRLRSNRGLDWTEDDYHQLGNRFREERPDLVGEAAAAARPLRKPFHARTRFYEKSEDLPSRFDHEAPLNPEPFGRGPAR